MTDHPNLKPEDRALFERICPGNTSLTDFMDVRIGHGQLAMLLDAARQEGRRHPTALDLITLWTREVKALSETGGAEQFTVPDDFMLISADQLKGVIERAAANPFEQPCYECGSTEILGPICADCNPSLAAQVRGRCSPSEGGLVFSHCPACAENPNGTGDWDAGVGCSADGPTDGCEAVWIKPPSPPPSGEVREAVARIIWRRFAEFYRETWDDEPHKAEYLSVADAILALIPTRDEAALPEPVAWRVVWQDGAPPSVFPDVASANRRRDLFNDGQVEPLYAAPTAPAAELPGDVVRLVIAVREVQAFAEDIHDAEDAALWSELDAAVEAFSARVPYENEPEVHCRFCCDSGLDEDAPFGKCTHCNPDRGPLDNEGAGR